MRPIITAFLNKSVIGLDTEFIRTRTYWPQLSLIQCHNGENALIVDGLTQDVSFLKEILLNPDIVKVVHSARQDLEIFYQLWGQIINPIFDTQIAARLCGFGYEVSLFQLVKEIFDVELEKSVQFSDWLTRPLSPIQLSYAEQDVNYLIPLYHTLKQQLEEQNQYEAFLQAQQGLLSQETYEIQPHKAWQRVKGHKTLKKSQRAWLKVLAAWREEQAARQNKIRRLILPDEILIKVATWQPQRQEKLAHILHRISSEHLTSLWKMIEEAHLLNSDH